MIPALVVLVCSQLGLGSVPRKMLLDILENMAHKILTAYGDLSAECLATKIHKHVGTGQGSGGSPHFWTSISEVILNSVDKDLPGFHSSNLTGMVKCIRNEDAFVDDSRIAINDTSGPVNPTLEVRAQIHENIFLQQEVN